MLFTFISGNAVNKKKKEGILSCIVVPGTNETITYRCFFVFFKSTLHLSLFTANNHKQIANVINVNGY